MMPQQTLPLAQAGLVGDELGQALLIVALVLALIFGLLFLLARLEPRRPTSAGRPPSPRRTERVPVIPRSSKRSLP